MVLWTLVNSASCDQNYTQSSAEFSFRCVFISKRKTSFVYSRHNRCGTKILNGKKYMYDYVMRGRSKIHNFRANISCSVIQFVLEIKNFHVQQHLSTFTVLKFIVMGRPKSHSYEIIFWVSTLVCEKPVTQTSQKIGTEW